jgi:hypothetical protein
MNPACWWWRLDAYEAAVGRRYPASGGPKRLARLGQLAVLDVGTPSHISTMPCRFLVSSRKTPAGPTTMWS